MHLENIVWDAREPHRLRRFWAAALGAEPIPDDDDCSRLHLGDGLFLDLCFQSGPRRPGRRPLHLDLLGGPRQAAVVEDLLALGATHADIGQGDVPWVVLADPEGNPFCVMEDRPEYRATGPIAALSDGGALINFLVGAHVTPADVRAAYEPDRWARLVEIKTTWDPDNVFRINHNIPPRVATG